MPDVGKYPKPQLILNPKPYQQGGMNALSSRRWQTASSSMRTADEDLETVGPKLGFLWRSIQGSLQGYVVLQEFRICGLKNCGTETLGFGEQN